MPLNWYYVRYRKRHNHSRSVQSGENGMGYCSDDVFIAQVVLGEFRVFTLAGFPWNSIIRRRCETGYLLFISWLDHREVHVFRATQAGSIQFWYFVRWRPLCLSCHSFFNVRVSSLVCLLFLHLLSSSFFWWIFRRHRMDWIVVTKKLSWSKHGQRARKSDRLKCFLLTHLKGSNTARSTNSSQSRTPGASSRFSRSATKLDLGCQTSPLPILRFCIDFRL